MTGERRGQSRPAAGRGREVQDGGRHDARASGRAVAAAGRRGAAWTAARCWSPARRAASASRPPCGWPGSGRTSSCTAASRAAERPRSRPCAPRPRPRRRRRCIWPTSARSPASAAWRRSSRRDRRRLDVLVANAGVYCPARQESRDGLELTFAVNVVAPVLLAVELLPLLRAAAPARVVILSSASHWTGEIHWDDLQLARAGRLRPAARLRPVQAGRADADARARPAPARAAA